MALIILFKLLVTGESACSFAPETFCDDIFTTTYLYILLPDVMRLILLAHGSVPLITKGHVDVREGINSMRALSILGFRQTGNFRRSSVLTNIFGQHSNVVGSFCFDA